MSNFRLAFIKFGLILAVLVFLSTEILSFFNALNTTNIRIFWAIVACVWAYVALKNRWLQSFAKSIKQSWQKLSKTSRWLWASLGIFYFLPLIFLSIYCPPNNTDSLNYHLARVVFWLQNQNVEHFPTPFAQQLYHNVCSEYFLLHIFALSGWHDYFVNLVQTFAMIGSLCALSLVAIRLRLDRHAQTLACVFLVTLPIGIFESTTTQNDYLACFFFLSFVWFVVNFSSLTPPPSPLPFKGGGVMVVSETPLPKRGGAGGGVKKVFWLAIALAFGCFTKYPIFFFAFPFCLWFGYNSLRLAGFRQSLYIFLTAALVLVLVFAPFFSRNYALFGNVLGSQPGDALFVENVVNERFDLGAIVSNLIKNLTLNLSLPIEQYNDFILEIINKIHHWLNVNPSDPQLTVERFRVNFTQQEDMTSNTWHFMLILVSGLWLIFQKGYFRLKITMLCAIVGFVLFSVFIKYQVYNSRIEISLFALGALGVAAMLSTLKKPAITNSLVVVLVLLGLPSVFGNINKILIPFRPLVKQAMGHIPPSICLAINHEKEAYKAALGGIYDFSGKDWCSPLVKHLPYFERLKVLKKLDSLNYFANEYQTVFGRSREQNYYRGLYDDYGYRDMQTIVGSIPDTIKSVGLFYPIDLGHYREWAMFQSKLGKAVEMQYIVYPKECEKAPNTSKEFEYQYILTHSLRLTKQHIDTTQIESIVQSTTLKLIKLKQPTSHIYHVSIDDLKPKI